MEGIVRGTVNNIDLSRRQVALVRGGDNVIICCNFPTVESLDPLANKLYFNRGDQLSLQGVHATPTIFNVKNIIGVELPSNIDSFKIFIISNMNRVLDVFHVSKIYDHLHAVAEAGGTVCCPEDQLSIYADMWIDNKTSVGYEDFLTLSYTDGDGRVSRIFKGDAFDRMMTAWIKFYDLRKLQAMGLTNEEIEYSGYSSYGLRKQLMENPYLVASVTPQRCALCDMYTGRTPLVTDPPCHVIKRKLWLDVRKKKWSCTPLADLSRMCRNIHQYTDVLQDIYEVVIDDVILYHDDDRMPGDTTSQPSVVGSSKMYYLKKQYDVVMLLKNEVIRRMKDDTYHPLGTPLITNQMLDTHQREGIYQAMNNNISIITGPAGSGKTTLLKELCHNLEIHNLKYAVASFTGKAVVRARQMGGLGERAATLHRMLSGNSPNADFMYLIIDEATMTSNELMYEFLKAYPRNFPILLIGDINQLQPIDWGGFFRSLVDCRSIPITYLSNIHRVTTSEGYEDGIIKNTTGIANWPDGQLYTFKQTPNFITIDCNIMEVAALVQSFKDNGSSQNDVTVLCPYAKNYGVGEMNTLLQTIWCGDNQFVKNGEELWFVGGRVMMLNNNYDIDVFNGQEGTIISVCDQYVEVNFPFVQAAGKQLPAAGCTITQTGAKTVDGVEMISYDRLVKFPFKFQGTAIVKKEKDSSNRLHISSIKLSYVISVHKSQGSEWANVIYYIPREANMNGSFITREMTYVALSRSSKMAIVAGSPYNAIKSIGCRSPYRCEMLTNYFKKELPRLYNKIEKVFTFDHSNTISEDQCDIYVGDDDDFW